MFVQLDLASLINALKFKIFMTLHALDGFMRLPK